MRYHVLGSYLFFINKRFTLTFEREPEQWADCGSGFKRYPVSNVSVIGQVFVWNDIII